MVSDQCFGLYKDGDCWIDFPNSNYCIDIAYNGIYFYRWPLMDHNNYIKHVSSYDKVISNVI